MKSRLPTSKQIKDLLAFLPLLYADGFTPVRRWWGGTQDENGVWTMPWPEYNPVVDRFVRAASVPSWCDHEYVPEEAGRMLETEGLIERASLVQIKSMLTFCIRGERFCSGHWAGMIEQGYIRRLLGRLAALQSEGAEKSAA